MQTVHFLGNARNCYNRHFYPVRAWKKELLEAGIKTRFFPNPRIPGIKECDTLIVFADGYKDILPIKAKSKQAGIEYLSVFFNKFDRVIWFDDHDSSGMLDPQVFSLVYIYAKAQILKDKNYYLKPHQISAIHRDYIYEQHGVDDKPIFKGVVTQQDLAKLRLGWNLSLINWNYYFASSKFAKLYHLLKSEPHKNQSPTPDLLSRNKQVIFRGRMWENEPTVGCWREETVMYNKTINDRESLPTQNPKETVS